MFTAVLCLALSAPSAGPTWLFDEVTTKGLDIPGEPHNEGWGVTTTIVLPGGLDILLYQPRHPTVV